MPRPCWGGFPPRRAPMFGASGPRPFERCARRPSAAPRICRRKTRSCSRWRTRARPNGIARTPPGSSRHSCSSRTRADYREFDERFGFLFNSYYVAAGPRHARPERGLITRPNVEEVAAYRAHVDARGGRSFCESADAGDAGEDRADRRDRAAPRAAASGADADRHPARLRAEPDPSRLRSPAGSRRPSSGGDDYAEICRPASIRSASTATASASTTSSRRIRCCCRRRVDRAPSRHQRRVAEVHGRRRLSRRTISGCRTAGPRSRPRAGTRRAIGATSTAPGSR